MWLLSVATTIPRSGCSSLLISTRMALKVMSVIPDKLSVITFIGDPECVISSVENKTSVLKPFFHNHTTYLIMTLRRILWNITMKSWFYSDMTSITLVRVTRGVLGAWLSFRSFFVLSGVPLTGAGLSSFSILRRFPLSGLFILRLAGGTVGSLLWTP